MRGNPDMRQMEESSMYDTYVTGIQMPPCRRFVNASATFDNESPPATNGLRNV